MRGHRVICPLFIGQLMTGSLSGLRRVFALTSLWQLVLGHATRQAWAGRGSAGTPVRDDFSHESRKSMVTMSAHACPVDQ